MTSARRARRSRCGPSRARHPACAARPVHRDVVVGRSPLRADTKSPLARPPSSTNATSCVGASSAITGPGERRADLLVGIAHVGDLLERVHAGVLQRVHREEPAQQARLHVGDAGPVRDRALDAERPFGGRAVVEHRVGVSDQQDARPAARLPAVRRADRRAAARPGRARGWRRSTSQPNARNRSLAAIDDLVHTGGRVRAAVDVDHRLQLGQVLRRARAATRSRRLRTSIRRTLACGSAANHGGWGDARGTRSGHRGTGRARPHRAHRGGSARSRGGAGPHRRQRCLPLGPVGDRTRQLGLAVPDAARPRGAPASSRRPAKASITSRPETASCWPGRFPAAPAPRAGGAAPVDAITGGNSRARLHTTDGRPLVGTLSIGGLATHTVVQAPQVIPVPAGTRSGGRVPARVWRLHRDRCGDQHRPGPTRRHHRGDRSRWDRAVGPAGRPHGGRRAADRDRPGRIEVRRRPHVGRDRRGRREPKKTPSRRFAPSPRRRGGRLVRGHGQRGGRRAGRGDARARRDRRGDRSARAGQHRHDRLGRGHRRCRLPEEGLAQDHRRRRPPGRGLREPGSRPPPTGGSTSGRS